MQIITTRAMQNTMTGTKFFIDKMLHHASFIVKTVINYDVTILKCHMLLLSLNVTFVVVALSLFGYLFLFVNSVNLLIN